jgi:hypothetical protein
MAPPIIYVDRSEIRQGKLTELKLAIEELTELVESNEPQVLAYQVYFDDEGTHMTVLHVHRDSESLALHMRVAGPAFAKFLDLIELQSIDLYGQPSDDLLEQLQAKSRMLGAGTVQVHGFQVGFHRFDLREPDPGTVEARQ